MHALSKGDGGAEQMPSEDDVESGCFLTQTLLYKHNNRPESVNTVKTAECWYMSAAYEGM